MLTRCPHCETTFRVSPEHLKVRQGKVRCGQCREVFDALEGLADEPQLAPVAAFLPSQEVEAQDEVLLPSSATEIPAADELEPASAYEPDPESKVEFVPASEPETEPEPQTSLEAEVVPQIDSEPEQVQELEQEPKLQPEPEPQPAIPADFEPVPDVAVVVTKPLEPQKSTLPEQWADVEPDPAPRQWFWAIGLVFLLPLAVVQLLFIYRVELTVIMPELRPALVTACDLLGCRIPYPRKVELVSIETSDLVPEGEGRLLLTATLKNRAVFVQEHPYLELTLTDTRDEPILRKVLAPVDYLSVGKNSATSGFGARGEIGLKLLLEARDVPAAGYRLYLFYP